MQKVHATHAAARRHAGSQRGLLRQLGDDGFGQRCAERAAKCRSVRPLLTRQIVCTAWGSVIVDRPYQGFDR